MNRAMLFRGKRLDGDWVIGQYIKACAHWHKRGIHEDWIVVGAIQNGGMINILGRFAVIPETVGQFTGLCDKNGNKIFEGDIVKVTYTEQRQYQGVSYQDEHSCVEEVIYSEKSACFMLKIMCEDIPLYRPLHNFGSLANIKELEVIGNIYDNPELLEMEQ